MAVLLRCSRGVRSSWFVGATLAVSYVLALAAMSFAPIAYGLERWAESAAHNTVRHDIGYYDVAIVLGGYDDLERVGAGAALVRSGEARNLLVSGQRTDYERLDLLKMLRSLAVPFEHTVLELNSRNTRENAAESGRIVAEHGWRTMVLITSADHMPRAEGCFRKLGLAPDTLPVAYKGGRSGEWRFCVSARRISVMALHELFGRVYYHLLRYS